MKGGATFNTKGADAILTMGKRLAKLRGMTVKVGVQKGATGKEGQLIAPYAAHNNFGTKNAMGGVLIPARPFMTLSAKGIKEWMGSRAFAEAVSKLNAGKMTPEGLAHLIGTQAKTITEQAIRNGDYKENHPITLARKKAKGQGSKPLIATESLVKNIRYIIVRAK